MVTFEQAKALADLIGSDHVIFPDSPDYHARRKVWNGMIDRHPALIVRPATAAQVSAVVTAAARSGIPLAVRCGGHSFPGFSTCDDGIVLDLTRMNQITVDPEARIAEVGGGALLGDLDRAGAPHGLVTPAGLVSHTGAGGLTLGGGMGWTSRRLGLTIDSLLAVELVTAEGRVIEVSNDSDPDLFWGLRGGGGNFGIVTKFRFRMHRLGPITVGVWSYPPDRAVQALNSLAAASDVAPRSQTTVALTTLSGVHVTAFHSGDDGMGASSTAPFGHLAGPGEGGLVATDYVTLQSRGDDRICWGRRYYGRGGFLAKPDGAIAETIAELARSAPTPDSEIYMIQLGGAVSDVAEDATAYSGRGGGFYWIVQPIWDDPADDARCLDWGRKGGARLAALSQAGNYLNEQGETGRDVALQAYGAAKFERLTRLKARMDPGNLFRLNQNIAPAPGLTPA
ncbi:FAD-binding oxidoreductase [Frigidibacter sp. RF13]|uniref:FAD-binding oxidoreductase n=1 Tax=Frigidibacter sp. RF13 TaxID=2997340 RepID=UPI002270C0FB|nr:FAD-binding oxidoreductase [Frigidibacter sp. RF13]MCY1126216.1 FAD-binding oxidoreductase [Frigidibacter sp. RF13]